MAALHHQILLDGYICKGTHSTRETALLAVVLTLMAKGVNLQGGPGTTFAECRSICPCGMLQGSGKPLEQVF